MNEILTKRTVTDKLVDQAFRRLAWQLEMEYERCTQPAGEEWFALLDRVELRLHEMLAKRPLTKAEINSIGLRALKALREPLRAIQCKQPKTQEMQECVDITTGKVRLIPRE